MFQFDILKDKSEIVPYNTPEFPVYFGEGKLSNFYGKKALCHWHDDLEFIMAVEGYMVHSVNGNDFRLNEGEAILINAKQLHYGYSDDGTDCKYICILLHPKLLCTSDYIENKFVNPIIKHSAFKQMILTPAEIPGNALIEYYNTIYRTTSIQKMGYELEILSLFWSIWKQLFQIYNTHENLFDSYLDKNLSIQKNMINFIHKRYTDKIKLNDIAAAGNVCRSKCCAMFKNYLNQTPIEFLNRYRLERGIDFIISSSASITEIALSCGFTNPSYFTEIFRQYKGCTPTEYRAISKK